MSANSDREQRVAAIEKRLGDAQGAVEEEPPKAPVGRGVTAAPARGTRRKGRFPGAGRSLSGEDRNEGVATQSDDEEAEVHGGGGDSESGDEDNADSDAASDFGDDFQDDDDDDDDDAEDNYSSSSEQRKSRSGLGTYNLRAPGSKRKHAANASASESDEGGPALRRRTRAAVSYTEHAVSDADSGSDA
ncbi:hypothetical protein H4R19_000006 [Coemansia spiralis]|nr:hypothetical protein H4R19_000006 [Coemansia spiralis]